MLSCAWTTCHPADSKGPGTDVVLPCPQCVSAAPVHPAAPSDAAVCDMQNLETLHLRRTRVKQAAADRLLPLLPHCTSLTC